MFKYIFVALFASLLLGSCMLFISNPPVYLYYIAITGDSGRKVRITYMDKHPWKSRFKVTKEVTLPYFEMEGLIDVSRNKKYTNPFLEVKTSDDDSTTQAVLMNTSVKLRLEGNGCYVTPFIAEGRYRYYSQNGEDSVACSKVTIDSVFSYLKKVGYPCYMSFEKGERVKSVNMYDARNWKPK